jgi:hypothetical protein
MATASDKNYGWNYGRVVALDKNADLAQAEGMEEVFFEAWEEDIECSCATCDYERWGDPEVLGTENSLSNYPQK